ncbi:LapA family protein [Rhizobium sp. WSM1325]|uniref:LapA family protein n=1 Tax=Rhizobium sp. WSM1325 TaxID=3444086 RepID=UPI001FE0516B|nr:LapA family protein [Rhizobium leguminosarum]
MDPYISALMGLAGVVIGGLASFATAWMTHRSQVREKQRELEAAKREKLFSDFIAEATRLYADAISHQKGDVSDLVLLYALVAQMRLISSRRVVDAAELAMARIVKTYLTPNRSLSEMRDLAHSGAMNFLLDFSEACRAELATGRAASGMMFHAPRGLKHAQHPTPSLS